MKRLKRITVKEEFVELTGSFIQAMILELFIKLTAGELLQLSINIIERR
ncbi:MAG: hypothetical protein K9K76_12075 [Halanaerobiales bacterium]|nr:hypothetical protein [Halanaerobiales bacterium]